MNVVTVNGEKATSFGNVADSYDRVRPGPAAAALAWLVPAGCEVAVEGRPCPMQRRAAEPGRDRANRDGSGHRAADAVVVLAGRPFVTSGPAGERPGIATGKFR